MATHNALTDYGTKLYAKIGGASKYAKLVSVTAVPATGAAGGRLEYTPLDSSVKLYRPDRQDTVEMDFTYNYTVEYKTQVDKACTGTEQLFLIKYADGSGVQFAGLADTWINAVSRGSIVEANLHIVPTTAMTYMTAAQVTAVIDDNASI